MAILFAGGELESFVVTGSVNNVGTGSSLYDNNFARCAIRSNGSAGSGNSTYADLRADYLEGWAHYELHTGNTRVNNYVTWMLATNTSQGVFRIRLTGTSTPVPFAVEYWNGSSWVSWGTFQLAANNVIYQLDIHWNIADVGGVLEVFVNGAQVFVQTGDTLQFVGATGRRVYFSSLDNSANANSGAFSQCLVTSGNQDTRSMKVATLGPNAAGATTQWSGTFADVDEVGNWNDADYIFSGTTNQVSTFNLADLSATAATLDPLAVVTGGRARKGTGGPQNIQHAIRTGGVDYFSANDPTLGTSFGTMVQGIWELNPGTGLPWTVSDINALQAGFKSIA